MSTAVTASPAALAATRAIVASLPRSFALGGPDAPFAVLAGAGDWDRALLGQAAREAVVALDPDPIPADRAARLDGSRLLLGETFAGHPAVAQLLERGDAALAGIGSMSLLAVGRSPIRSLLLQQLRLLRAVGVDGVTVRDAQIAERTALVTATGRRAGTELLLRLQAARSDAGPVRHELRGYGADTIVSLEIPDSDTARPAVATITDPSGQLRLPDVYEHAHRAQWRAWAAGGGRSDALPGLVEDLRTLEAAAPA